jgi:hypothetical protein
MVEEEDMTEIEGVDLIEVATEVDLVIHPIKTQATEIKKMKRRMTAAKDQDLMISVQRII